MYAKTTLAVTLALIASTAIANEETKMEAGAVPSFTTLDANADGSVSKDEAATSTVVLDQWDSLDADQSGSLSSTEYANVAGSSTDTEDASDDESKY
jgi:hypothetical protein